MGNGWHEWPLVLFTVLGQTVVGALLVCAAGWASMKENVAARQRIVRMMFFLWIAMGIGFFASMMHLGSPLRALNSLNRVGQSGLSNEIAAGSVFFAVGGMGWLASIAGKLPLIMTKLWLGVSSLLGVIFIAMMSLVYQIETVPTWHTGLTTLHFFLTAFLCGPLFGAILLRAAKVNINGTMMSSISLLALLATVGMIIFQGVSLAAIHSSVQQAAALVPDYAGLQVIRIVLLTVGFACWLCPLMRRKLPLFAGMLAGFVLVACGELIGRTLFYGLHMTVGLTVAG
ncbi:DmsC/YnfH family molybdoenzyme membrane anchor subunit [Pseudocitrobacter corydidari]|uniref:Anaerobic dimethyl sulfoxide reductase chain C n=1 Tax=Pseudocitrobacter corydidari TaxID=2891570 RepID=A0ABY3S3C1_9ENTR|nr:DmsC/YnfH family molybdoenzyme membrane anchor subunit [Pseudocitrobacter corydidari]UGS40593.1 Anaerobic dimethyl sulfoxide reductase chain C [Pseudocitrobacter corydidari]